MTPETTQLDRDWHVGTISCMTHILYLDIPCTYLFATCTIRSCTLYGGSTFSTKHVASSLRIAAFNLVGTLLKSRLFRLHSLIHDLYPISREPLQISTSAGWRSDLGNFRRLLSGYEACSFIRWHSRLWSFDKISWPISISRYPLHRSTCFMSGCSCLDQGSLWLKFQTCSFIRQLVVFVYPLAGFILSHILKLLSVLYVRMLFGCQGKLVA